MIIMVVLGSGNWHRWDKKTTTEEVHRVDIRYMYKQGLLRPVKPAVCLGLVAVSQSDRFVTGWSLSGWCSCTGTEPTVMNGKIWRSGYGST